MDDLKVEQLRTLDDFLLNSARFQVPNFSDLDKWARRVKGNLVYYQTNYFLMAIIIFLIVGIMHPAQMLLGMICVGALFGGYDYLSKNQRFIADIKKNHPLVCLVVVFVGGYLLISMLGSVMVFMFGVLLPISSVFIHSSLRLRNTKNKITSIKEQLSITKSPMTVLLDILGMKFEGFDD
ncbi:unnamed protein product [Orchesella dallaii]|uniref:PRA1 family protein n=1 Tax=Orchesella dallaii TaxID=48710 RepID=A0ABP1PY78_9HEXA